MSARRRRKKRDVGAYDKGGMFGELEPCKLGRFCPSQRDNKHRHEFSHPCKRGLKCSKYKHGAEAHCRLFTHGAEGGDEAAGPGAGLGVALRRRRRKVARCPLGRRCRNRAEAHVQNHTHPCRHGTDCKFQSDEDHCALFSHMDPPSDTKCWADVFDTLAIGCIGCDTRKKPEAFAERERMRAHPLCHDCGTDGTRFWSDEQLWRMSHLLADLLTHDGELNLGNGTEDLARAGTASQSSSRDDGLYPANLVIDGQDHTYSKTVPGGESPAWVQVELATPALVSRIELHNQGARPSLLRDVIVTVVDTDGTELFRSDVLNPNNATPVTTMLPITVRPPVWGSSIRVTRNPGTDDVSRLPTTAPMAGDDDVVALKHIKVFSVSGTGLADALLAMAQERMVEQGKSDLFGVLTLMISGDAFDYAIVNLLTQLPTLSTPADIAASRKKMECMLAGCRSIRKAIQSIRAFVAEIADQIADAVQVGLEAKALCDSHLDSLFAVDSNCVTVHFEAPFLSSSSPDAAPAARDSYQFPASVPLSTIRSVYETFYSPLTSDALHYADSFLGDKLLSYPIILQVHAHPDPASLAIEYTDGSPAPVPTTQSPWSLTLADLWNDYLPRKGFVFRHDAFVSFTLIGAKRASPKPTPHP